MARPTLLLRTSDLVLNPAARVLWRGPDSLQLELGAQSIVLDGIDRATVRSLLRRELAAGSADTDVLRRFDSESLETLMDEGFVWPVQRGEAPLACAPSPRLAADLTSLAARHGRYAPGVLAARQSRSVAITGRGRAAVGIACLIAASGVGRVYFTDSGDVHLSQTMPGGLGPDAEGRRFAAIAAAAVHAAAPDVDTSASAIGETPDLTVVATNEPIDSAQRDALHERGCAHLVVRLASSSGVVGPLVVPGLTSCLHCADLYRRDRDPAWHSLAVQLTVPPHRGAPSDVGVAAVLGGVAAVQTLEFFDTGTCAAIDGTLELRLPDWRLRRRSWPQHAECDCV